MKTSIEAVNILYLLIKNSELINGTEKINGGLYKFKRPLNSELEDIVINSLPINNEELQECVLNVNIYVKNLSLNVNGITDNSLPNTSRLDNLLKIATELLEEYWHPEGDYQITLQQENLFEDENNQHYLNLRIEFYSPKN